MNLPDYVGQFAQDPVLDEIGFGIFYLYVDKKIKLENGDDYIIGRTKDIAGDGIFCGIINEFEVEFVKKYSNDAIQRGGAENPVAYDAIGMGGLYQGLYTVFDDDTPFGKMNWSDKFALIDINYKD